MIGERLCLDFANTAGWHNGDNPNEWLINYEKLLAWSRHAEILNTSQEKALLEKARRHSDQAEKALEEAIELREAIFRLFRSIATGKKTDTFDLAILNKYFTKANYFAEIIPRDGEFALTFQRGEDQLNCMLHPIVKSAIDLLLSGKLNRVKLCEGDPCGWLFFDSSRNKSRRWCTMADCGNRAKARRFYHRKK
ncbi:putative RNA-binding Zn ribbon-like protein [Scopulibacillus darangshiensis]|uniref:Putative RNA-binding Zn ribbon-like protein n=1 Tax=Scopulibacillus darangshiensis TaxID=442528 RepID=A0A4V2SMV3_9BACL|nr:putative RNA-binding Zn ribbon-like protein [Scopulibacillus darangshiensis]